MQRLEIGGAITFPPCVSRKIHRELYLTAFAVRSDKPVKKSEITVQEAHTVLPVQLFMISSVHFLRRLRRNRQNFNISTRYVRGCWYFAAWSQIYIRKRLRNSCKYRQRYVLAQGHRVIFVALHASSIRSLQVFELIGLFSFNTRRGILRLRQLYNFMKNSVAWVYTEDFRTLTALCVTHRTVDLCHKFVFWFYF